MAKRKAAQSRPAPSSGKPPRTRGAAVPKKNTRKWGRIKTQLLERRAAISQGMEHSLDYNDAPPLTRGDASDLAADALDSDTTLQLAESGSTELAQIEQALRKIEEGTYGECEACGSDIPASRLEALPYAILCVKCKERQEREGGPFPGAPGWSAVDEIEEAEPEA